MTWWQLLQPSGHDRPQNDFLFKGSYTDCYRPLMGNVYNLHWSASVTRETNTLAMGNNIWSSNIHVPFTKTTQYKGLNMETTTKSLCSLLLLCFLAFNCRGKKRTYSEFSQKTIWILYHRWNMGSYYWWVICINIIYICCTGNVCGPGWIAGVDDTCLTFNSTSSTWDAAMGSCKDMGGTLATTQGQSRNAFVIGNLAMITSE